MNDGDDNYNNMNGGVNFLVDHMEDYFQDVTLADKTFDPNNHKHVMIKYIYEAFDFQEFQKIIQWGLDQKSTLIDAYIDFQMISNINKVYLESKNKKQSPSQSQDPILQEDQLSEDHPLQIIATKIFDIQAFTNNATDIINSVSAALDKIRVNKLEKKFRKRVCTQFYNFDKVTIYQDIKANIVNQFISIKGIVLKTSPVKLMYKKLRFQCVDCKGFQSLRLKNGNYSIPSKCGNVNCKSKNFTALKNDPQNIVVQYQKLRVQEIEEGDQVSGRVPRYIDCELQQNLVSQVINGDNVIVNGILRTEVIDSGIGQSKKNQGLYQNFLEVNSISNYKNDKGQGQGGNFQEEEEFSEQDMNLINQLSESKHIFYLLIKSVCPTIYGHELMKAGILFAIIGGSNFQNKSKDQNNIFNLDSNNKDLFRSDSHVLLIGDPGLGKSQMLKFVANITTRSVYVCGNATSNAGLTVSVTRDASGEGTLEAGALILSDQGVCCIDEFDKMNDQHQALLEAMEQQTVSLAKSGVLCSLQCRASIIACANPIGGHYNKAKSIKENIKISNAVLSRFDLIFLMLDRPDPDRDAKLSKHIMKLHNNLHNQGQQNINQNKKRSYNELQNNKNNIQQQNLPNYLKQKQIETPRKSKLINDTIQNLGMQEENDDDDEFQNQQKYASFSEKLQKEIAKIKSPILDPAIIRKYLQFTKKHICPVLSEEASEVLKNFYITLRENNMTTSSMPITARQLESMIRLAQARAKIECRETVTEQDAQDVVDLMYESLFDSLEDMSYGTGGGAGQSKRGGGGGGGNIPNNLKNVDTNNIGTLSKPKQTKLFVAKLQQECDEKQDDMFSLQDLTRIARQMNMNVGDFRMYVEELNCKGTIIHKGNKKYQLKEKSFM